VLSFYREPAGTGVVLRSGESFEFGPVFFSVSFGQAATSRAKYHKTNKKNPRHTVAGIFYAIANNPKSQSAIRNPKSKIPTSPNPQINKI